MAKRSGHWASLAAPAAFLLGVTIAILLVRSALNDGSSSPAGETRPAARSNRPRPKPPGGRAQYAVVKAGDTFGTIAARFGLTVKQLERLNPGVKSTSLFIGQKIRVG